MRADYDVKELYLGTGLLDEYTFDFKIESLEHLLVIVVDDAGVEAQRLRGSDVTFLDHVDYDATEGGGTVVLQAVLPSDYTIILLLANDEPTQPSRFRRQGAFTLLLFELAMDYITGPVQRLAYLAQRSMKLHDLDDSYEFDTTLPPGIKTHPEHLIMTNLNDDGESDAFVMISLTEALGLSSNSEQAVTDGQGATALTGHTIVETAFTSRVYWYEIMRGTTVLSTGSFSLHYRNGDWYIVMGQDNRDDNSAPHGVTFTLGLSGSVQQLYAELDMGAGDGTIKLKVLTNFTA